MVQLCVLTEVECSREGSSRLLVRRAHVSDGEVVRSAVEHKRNEGAAAFAALQAVFFLGEARRGGVTQQDG